MPFLAATNHKLQLVTSAAADVDVQADYMDLSIASTPPQVVGGGPQNTPTIVTATTTDILSAPASANIIRTLKSATIRNTHATVTCDVTVIHNLATVLCEICKFTLAPGDLLVFNENGLGWFKIAAVVTTGVSTNRSSAQQTGFAADTYLAGSSIPMQGIGVPQIGWTYQARFDVTKTAVGIAAPVITLRTGAAGTTADTARCTFTFGAGTAAVDTAVVTVTATFKSVGAGAAAVLAGAANADNLATTGWSSTIKAAKSVSAGFDSTAASQIIGLSYNGGASAAHTIEQVTAELKQF